MLPRKTIRFAGDPELRGIKPGQHRFDASDAKTRGLIVRVSPATATSPGRKTFCLVARLPGATSPTRMALGDYPGMSLREARDKADHWRRLIQDGIDPRPAPQPEAPELPDLSFGAAIEDYIKRQLSSQRRGAVGEREIRRELIPHWRARRVDEITRADVVRLVERIADRPAPGQAHIVLGHIRAFFNWAIDRGKYGLEVSPCDRLKPARLIGAKKPRQRVLTDIELAALWAATEALGYPYGPLVRLLVLTGGRLGEVSGARWREFPPALVKILRGRKDGEAIDWQAVPSAVKLWTVPPERFKSDAVHMVPLADDALRVLETLPHFAAGDLLFSTTYGAKAVNGFGKAKERLDREMLAALKAAARLDGAQADDVTLPDFVLHDLRRTVRTRLSSLRVSDRVAEMVIGHAARGLQRVYDQHSFADEMREALDLWAARLRSIVSPPPTSGNVVALRA